jgi:hypothetical protein
MLWLLVCAQPSLALNVMVSFIFVLLVVIFIIVSMSFCSLSRQYLLVVLNYAVDLGFHFDP